MAAAEVPSTEVDALLAWKASLVAPATLSGWSRNVTVCSWVGVVCDAISVVELALPGLGLSGGLATLYMPALPALALLDLNGNNLVGDIPASISRLRSLQVLDLGNNRFSGSIPPELGDLSRLFHVQLSHNNLAGDIPHQLCRLLSIKGLDLSNNRLSGELPACWCNLQALQFIDLSQNQLTGKLPDCWWNLQSFMDLSTNSFSVAATTCFEQQNWAHWSKCRGGDAADHAASLEEDPARGGGGGDVLDGLDHLLEDLVVDEVLGLECRRVRQRRGPASRVSITST
ncbi:hypothetical protein QYE76_019456 [Lolium multiflorum]|uniref:Leucine-rich repeat-containing N-terminal plant-type domain-containing protein n=1 Tax=Lolium multiflorum TaxID=4521 RepID=A0AAD8VP43_LOLMU|nr:hypothetical protein QYE76_019456 [Lolium multiflorum]